MDRETVGLNALGSYESYLEGDLPNSKMSEKIIKRFEEIDSLHQVFEDFSTNYDLLLEQLNERDNSKRIIRLIAKKLEAISDFPGIADEDEIDEEKIEEVKKWFELKLDSAYRVAEESGLTDTLSYGDSISIKGVDDSEMILSIDEILINPSADDEIEIDITLSEGIEKVASGFVKLTVGYLDYDEDGGVADGIDDSIDYEYDQIIEKIDEFILEQREQVDKEEEIINIIKDVLV